MRKAVFFMLILGVFLLCIPAKSNCYEVDKKPTQKQAVGSKFELETEYFLPLSKDQEIETSTLNLLFSKNNLDESSSYYRGLTIMHGWGSVDGMDVNPAFGIGPVFLKRYDIWQQDRLRLAIDMSGCLIFYSEDFPLEGGFYNFMWRLGPKLTLSDR